MDQNNNLGKLGVGLGCALIAVNFSIVSTALATIHQALNASFLELQWMLNAFGIFLCTTLVTMGRLSDSYGRRRLFLIGLIGSGVASVIAGTAPHPTWIIVAQILQGIFGAILLVGSQALMSLLFPESQRSRAIGLWAAIAGISLGLGPILAGIIISLLSWRWIFFINVPLVVLAIILVLRFVPESKSTEHTSKIDYPGMLLLMCAIGSLVLGVIQGPLWGWTSVWSILCAIVFVVTVPLFVFVETKVSAPIVHPEFFLKKNFLLPSFVNLCTMFFVWTIFFILPLYFQSGRNESPLMTGIMMLFATAPVALLSSKVGHWYEKVGARFLMTLGFVFLLISLGLQFLMTTQTPMLLVIVASFTFGLGWVLAWGPSTTAAISSLPTDLAGIASGAFTTIQEVGASIGLTITGTVFRLGQPTFMRGYQNSLWVLLIISIIGLIMALSSSGKRN